MRPPSPATFRRLLLVCVLLAALGLAACGGDSAVPDGSDESEATGSTGVETTITTGTGPGARKAGPKAKRPAPCKAQLGDLLSQLDRLRVRLATGLSYEQYTAAVRKTRAAYASLDVDRLPPDCLVAAGTDAEKSFNHYIEAANAWGECLADAGCNARVVEPELQRDWQVASHWLSEAHEGLKEIS